MLTLQSSNSRIVYLLIFKVKKDSLGDNVNFLKPCTPITIICITLCYNLHTLEFFA